MPNVLSTFFSDVAIKPAVPLICARPHGAVRLTSDIEPVESDAVS